MGRSRLGWACKAVAPWCVALGFVVSITAEAGQDPSLGASVASQNPADGPSSPMREALASSTLHVPGDLLDRTVDANLGLEARLTLGAPDDLSAVDDEIDPKGDLKQAKLPFPAIDRTGKGDPFIGLRPGFDARLNHHNGAGVRRADGTPAAIGDSPIDEALIPLPPTPANEQAGADSGAPQALAVSADEGRTFDDGATPNVPLDVALNSSTPTPNDGVRIVVAAKPAPETTLAPQTAADGKPDYAALIDPKDVARQQRCLAEAVYFEARSEPEAGQAAVAQVVLNRVRSGNYPANVCGVVYQDRNRPFACQFSFACEGKSLRIEEPGPWATAVRIAQDVVSGAVYDPQVGEAVNYHANYVMPYWASTLQRVDRIGHHIFYKVRVGQAGSSAPGALPAH
jgi:Cell Wall Hydrolase